MKTRLGAIALVAGLSIAATGGVASADQPDCNWGGLTAGAIGAGFDQGDHSSDPSGDGHGPGTVDEPRAGLANVVAQGDLDATCDLIESLLP
jgi:hypothetical protein